MLLIGESGTTTIENPAGGPASAAIVMVGAPLTVSAIAWLPPTGESTHKQDNVLGPLGHLWVAPSARIEPMVVIDATQGPVVIDEHAVVSAFTRLEGPCYVGPGTQVFGAKIPGVSMKTS